MFFYPPRTQTSPPLFLLVERVVVWVAPGNVTFRLLPLGCGLLACFLVYAVLRSLGLPRIATAIGTALVELSPGAIFYSRNVKPYAVEMALAAGILLVLARYLGEPTRGRFAALLALTSLGSAAGYGVAFLVPGVVAAVALGPDEGGRALARALGLAALSGAVLLVLGLVFVRPNLSATMRAFFSLDAPAPFSLSQWFLLGGDWLPPPRIASYATNALVAVGIVALCASGQSARAFGLAAAMPLLLLPLAGRLGHYPTVERTRLVLLPLAAILFARGAAALKEGLDRVSLGAVADAAVAALFLALRLHPWRYADRGMDEDVQGALARLESLATPADRVYVHSSCGEAFLLYSRLSGPPKAPVILGTTATPCCSRQAPAPTGLEAVRADFDRGLPRDFAGRVFEVTTSRLSHWASVGIDERPVVTTALAERGCRQVSEEPRGGVLLAVFRCAPTPGP
jgi:hypothetical protein